MNKKRLTKGKIINLDKIKDIKLQVFLYYKLTKIKNLYW